jgi:DNA repair protein RadC
VSKGYVYEYQIKRVRRSFAADADPNLGAQVFVAADAAKLMTRVTRHESREHFIAIFLSARQSIIGYETVAIGSANSVEAHPREIFRLAIATAACSVIIGHNHPSGSTSPSEADIAMTSRMIIVGDLLGIPVLDHVIVGEDADGDPCYTSLRETWKGWDA